MSTSTIHVTRADQGEHWIVGTDVITVRASGRHTSGNLLVVEVTVPPGGGPPLMHRHAYAEAFLFQEGDFEVSTADEDYVASTHEVGAGDTVSVPSMAWHNFKNVGEGAGRFIAVHSPAVMEDFVKEIGQKVEDPENPPAPGGPPSEEEMRGMMEVVGRYMEVLPPEKIRQEVGR